jgi:hypothetical protein
VPQFQNTFTASPGGSGSIADSFLCIVSLQIRKIATILRLWVFDPELYESRLQGTILLRGLNHVAIGPSRHHAIL